MARVLINKIGNRSPKITSPGGEILWEILGNQVSGVKSDRLKEVTILSKAPFHIISEASFLILSGEVELHNNQGQINFNTGDSMPFPPGESHQIINRSQEGLNFLVTRTPARQPDDNFQTHKDKSK